MWPPNAAGYRATAARPPAPLPLYDRAQEHQTWRVKESWISGGAERDKRHARHVLWSYKAPRECRSYRLFANNLACYFCPYIIRVWWRAERVVEGCDSAIHQCVGSALKRFAVAGLSSCGAPPRVATRTVSIGKTHSTAENSCCVRAFAK